MAKKPKATKPDLDNKLFYGNNLEVLRKYIKDESVDLVYIDPPFNSKRNYNQIYNNIGKEDKAQSQAFVDTWTWDDDAIHGFEEIITNYKNSFSKQTIQLIVGLEKVLGKSDLLAYLIHITLRATEIQRILKPTGSFYLHCDPTASHYLKLILDSVFCSKGGDFLNEIIWCYTIGGKAKNRFAEKHDVIFYYTKNNKGLHTFNIKGASIPRKSNTHMKTGKDIDGRLYQEKVDRKSQKVYRYYLDEGKIAEDYWTDIETLNREDKERLGYPTQKPLALLDRIIKTSTNEGDVVLDAYCGCGTTIDSAERLGRKWIGIDITYQSVSLILKRLKNNYGNKIVEKIELNGVPKDMESAIALANKKEDKTRKEFEKWSVLTYSDNRAIINEKKGADGGIDGIAFINDFEKNEVDVEIKQVLFSVKSDKKPHVSYIRDLNGAMQREGAVMGYFITLYPPTKDMLSEAKKLGKYKNKLFGKEYDRIKIITIEQILNGELFDVPKAHEIPVVKSSKTNTNSKNQIKIDL